MEWWNNKANTSHSPPLGTPHLFFRNKLCNEHNAAVLRDMPGSGTNITASDTVSDRLPPEVAAVVMATASKAADRKLTGNLLSNLVLKEGTRVGLTMNVSKQDGLTHGADGTVCGFVIPDGALKPLYVLVQFDDARVGKNLRSVMARQVPMGPTGSWTPIQRQTTTFNVNAGKDNKVSRTQFPLEHTAARTLHKAQGMTLSTVCLDLRDARPGMHYVAVSRVSDEAGLYFYTPQAFNSKHIKTDDHARVEMRRLRADCQLDLALPALQPLCKNNFVFVYHNARSLKKHIRHARACPDLRAAHVAAFSEARLQTRQCQAHLLEGCQVVACYDAQTPTVTHAINGSMLQCQAPVLSQMCGKPFITGDLGVEVIAVTVQVAPARRVRFVSVYRSPSSPYAALFDAICAACQMQQPSGWDNTVIMGDFNIDVLVDSAALTRCFTIMQSLHVTQRVRQFTCDTGSLIDHIWTDLQDCECGMGYSSYSDHAPIWLAMAR